MRWRGERGGELGRRMILRGWMMVVLGVFIAVLMGKWVVLVHEVVFLEGAFGIDVYKLELGYSDNLRG